ncbi:MAG: hypothetical protein DME94_01720 [Verrucomicrobia bacterium]|nr:MAG: hypothetical protein DME94_01720 [Verrucomicrobiota bacterium]
MSCKLFSKKSRPNWFVSLKPLQAPARLTLVLCRRGCDSLDDALHELHCASVKHPLLVFDRNALQFGACEFRQPHLELACDGFD